MHARRPEPVLFSQDRLREVLRLIECPRIEALLDRCTLDPPGANATSPPGSTTVAALMAFVEAGSRRGPQSAAVGGRGSNQKPPTLLPSAVAASKLPAELVHGKFKHCNVTAGSLPLSPVTPRATSDTTSTTATGAANTVATAATTVATAAATAATGAAAEATAETAATPATATTPGIETTPATAATPATTPSTDTATPPASTAAEALSTTKAVDGDGAYNDGDDDPVGSESVQLLTPRVVPLISKRALRGSTAAETNAGVSGANRRERPENPPGACQGSPLCSEQALGGRTPPEEGGAGEPRDNTKQPASSSSGRHSTTLVKHLGVVLGLRGREACRRPGRGQPVWRKRETVIQERIVQYTTLDEQGTVSSPTFSRDRQQEVGRRY